MTTCNKPIKCWDLLVRPCKRAAGHTPGLCNPFSADHPFDPVKIGEGEEEESTHTPGPRVYQKQITV